MLKLPLRFFCQMRKVKKGINPKCSHFLKQLLRAVTKYHVDDQID